MLDSAGKRVAEQGQLQFLAERREPDKPDEPGRVMPVKYGITLQQILNTNLNIYRVPKLALTLIPILQ